MKRGNLPKQMFNQDLWMDIFQEVKLLVIPPALPNPHCDLVSSNRLKSFAKRKHDVLQEELPTL